MINRKSIGVAAGAAVVLAPITSVNTAGAVSSAPADVQERRTGSGELVYADGGTPGDVWGIVCTASSGLFCKA